MVIMVTKNFLFQGDVLTLQTIILKLSTLQELFQSALTILAVYITNAINILSTTLKGIHQVQ